MRPTWKTTLLILLSSFIYTTSIYALPINTHSKYILKKKLQTEYISGPIKIAIISDTHNYSKLNYVFKQISKQNPLLIIHLGDITDHSTEREFRLFKDAVEKNLKNVPIFCVPGNHDNYNSGYMFNKYVGKSAFNLVIDNLQILGVDTSKHTITPNTIKYLYKRTKNNLLKILVSHIPPRAVLPRDISNNGFTNNQWVFLNTLNKLGVSYTFFGHTHKKYRTTYNGTIIRVLDPIMPRYFNGYVSSPSYLIVMIEKNSIKTIQKYIY